MSCGSLTEQIIDGMAFLDEHVPNWPRSHRGVLPISEWKVVLMPIPDKAKNPRWRLADGTMLVPGMSVMTQNRRVGVTDELFVKQWEEFANTFDGTVKVNFHNSDSVLHETYELVSLGTALSPEPTPTPETKMPTPTQTYYPPLGVDSPEETTEYAFFNVPLDPTAVIPDADKWLFAEPFRTFRDGERAGAVYRQFVAAVQARNGQPFLVGATHTPCKIVLVERTATTSYSAWQIKEIS